MLVEVSADDELPNVLEIAYPPIGNREARIGKLEVKYQWKPPLCTFCKTFGHTTMSCKVRPRTEEEKAAKVVNDSSKLKEKVVEKRNDVVIDNEGFVTMGRNNKPIGLTTKPAPVRSSNDINGNYKVGQNLNVQGNGRQSFVPKQHVMKQGNGSFDYGKGNYQQNSGNFLQRRYQVKANSNGGGVSNAHQDGVVRGKKVMTNKSLNAGMRNNANKTSSFTEKSTLQHLSNNPNFKPKVLVKGSSSKNPFAGIIDESVPIKNSYQVLIDEEMDLGGNDSKGSDIGDFDSVWPDLKNEVDTLMKAGIYPSKAVRLEWTVHQMDYFYKNCHKFNLDPCYEDDDVESEFDGAACDMKPEFDVAASISENDAAKNAIVSNDV